MTGEASLDRFLGGRLLIWQPTTGFRASTDAVLLAAAIPAKAGDSVLELGCGVGVPSLCLGRRVAGLRLCGIELQEDYAALANRNASANDIPLEVFCGDLMRLPAALRAMTFDHVIMNPPYLEATDGTTSRDSGRDAALRGATPITDWVAVGLRRLRQGGYLTAIAATDRLGDLLAALGGGKGTVILPLTAREGREAGRVIICARKGSRAPLRLVSPLVLHRGDRHQVDGDDYSDMARAVLRDGAALSMVRA